MLLFMNVEILIPNLVTQFNTVRMEFVQDD